jgi:hypothetical protein
MTEDNYNRNMSFLILKNLQVKLVIEFIITVLMTVS